MLEAHSPETRARAELALVRLPHELRHEDVFLVILGGPVPAVLARNDVRTPGHLGTTESTCCSYRTSIPEADLGGVNRALERIGFRPDADADPWRWEGQVEGAAVKLEFLCDSPTNASTSSSARGAPCTALRPGTAPAATPESGRGAKPSTCNGKRPRPPAPRPRPAARHLPDLNNHPTRRYAPRS